MTSTGVVDFDPAFDGFLDGRGTNTLVVTGVPVVLDYSRLSHHLITDILGAPELAPGVHHLRFAPSADKTGLAEPAGSRLTLTADGRGHHPVATFS